jgi:hypothetical protein
MKRIAANHLFVKQILPSDSWHKVDSDIGAIAIFLCQPALTLVSLLERYLLVLETAMPPGDIRKRPSAHL